MPSQNLFNSFCNLILPCLNFITNPIMRTHQDQASSTSAPSAITDLPPSLILEFLLKLPIKTIISCKCVCKSWHTLISDPYFAHKHFQNPPPYTVLVISQHRILINRLDEGSFYFLEMGTDGDVMRTPCNPKALNFHKKGFVSITGSCNGFLCLVDSPHPENEAEGSYVHNRDNIYNNQKVYVVNPLLGECMKLPRVARSENMSNVVYGFGLGANGTGDYKVVRIVSSYVFVGLGHEYKVQGEILTVGVDKGWRRFEDSCIPFYLFPSGVVLNGILHWIGDDRRSGFVFAFDIGQERAYRVPLPEGLRDDPANVVLALWDGKLSVTDNGSEVQVDVWTMKEYGVKESWTREIVLKRWIQRDLRPCSFIPVTTLKNGELLLSRRNEGDLSYCLTGQSMIAFDPKTKRCRAIEVPDSAGTVLFLFEYNPSFASFRDAGFLKK